jgi:hypothetical protein
LEHKVTDYLSINKNIVGKISVVCKYEPGLIRNQFLEMLSPALPRKQGTCFAFEVRLDWYSFSAAITTSRVSTYWHVAFDTPTEAVL